MNLGKREIVPMCEVEGISDLLGILCCKVGNLPEICWIALWIIIQGKNIVEDLFL